LIALSACGDARMSEHAGRLATAGIAFTDALPALYDESFRLAVAADSADLIDSRTGAAPSARQAAIEARDDLLKVRLASLDELKRHAILLRSYFLALSGLAGTDDAEGITTAAKSLLDRMAGLDKSLEKAKIGDAPLKNYVDPIVKFGMKTYRDAALRREFEERGSAISRELWLQRVAVEWLSAEMRKNAALISKLDELGPLRAAYAGADKPDAALPGTWREERLAALSRKPKIEQIASATKAVEALYQTWSQLIAGQSGETNISLLIQDVQELIAFAQALRAVK